VSVPGLIVLFFLLASLGSLAVVSLTLANVLAGWGIFFFYTVPALGLLAWAWRESSPSTWRRAARPFSRAWHAVAGRWRFGRRQGTTDAVLRPPARSATPPPSASLRESSVRVAEPAVLTSEPAAAFVRGAIHTWLRLMRAVLAAWRSPRGRAVVTVGFGFTALGISALVARHFASVGWPLARADLRLVAGAGALFLGTYAFKALGWQRLFRLHERPQSLALAASTGAASVAGIALPGRFADVVRVIVVRRLPGLHPGVGTIVLSLFLLGLLETATLTPFAAAAAVTSDASLGVRIALAVAAAAGVGAALLLAALTRMAASEHLARHRLTRWLGQHAPASGREACHAAMLVTTGWLVQAVALVVLLAALGLGSSFPLAVVFLTARAASAVLPIGPTSATTQAGAGAAVLAAGGIGTNQAVAFAVVAQALSILAGAAVLLFTALLYGGKSLQAERLSRWRSP
jgi:hypothetical protein